LVVAPPSAWVPARWRPTSLVGVGPLHHMQRTPKPTIRAGRGCGSCSTRRVSGAEESNTRSRRQLIFNEMTSPARVPARSRRVRTRMHSSSACGIRVRRTPIRCGFREMWCPRKQVSEFEKQSPNTAGIATCAPRPTRSVTWALDGNAGNSTRATSPPSPNWVRPGGRAEHAINLSLPPARCLLSSRYRRRALDETHHCSIAHARSHPSVGPNSQG
jgi:hypothetical protein